MGQRDDWPQRASALVAALLTLQQPQHVIARCIKIRRMIDASDATDVHRPIMTCGFAMVVLDVPALAPTGILCGSVITLLGECCIGCNSAHLERMAEVMPELVGVDLNAGLLPAPLDHLVNPAGRHRAAAHAEPQRWDTR